MEKKLKKNNPKQKSVPAKEKMKIMACFVLGHNCRGRKNKHLPGGFVTPISHIQRLGSEFTLSIDRKNPKVEYRLNIIG